jgi:multicomponent Na+:H+ antiporter subunit B
MRYLAWVALAATIGILFYAARDLPPVGDPQAPASTHVSPRYIEHSHEETGAANFVTAVVVDYRGYDTLGETTVIFTAGLACLLILGARLGHSRETDEHENSLR